MTFVRVHTHLIYLETKDFFLAVNSDFYILVLFLSKRLRP